MKLKAVTPAIELVEITASRGNTALTPVVQMTTSLRNRISEFTAAVESQEKGDGGGSVGTLGLERLSLTPGRGRQSATPSKGTQVDAVIAAMETLMGEIDAIVPYLNLAISA